MALLIKVFYNLICCEVFSCCRRSQCIQRWAASLPKLAVYLWDRFLFLEFRRMIQRLHYQNNHPFCSCFVEVYSSRAIDEIPSWHIEFRDQNEPSDEHLDACLTHSLARRIQNRMTDFVISTSRLCRVKTNQSRRTNTASHREFSNKWYHLPKPDVVSLRQTFSWVGLQKRETYDCCL